MAALRRLLIRLDHHAIFQATRRPRGPPRGGRARALRRHPVDRRRDGPLRDRGEDGAPDGAYEHLGRRRHDGGVRAARCEAQGLHPPQHHQPGAARRQRGEARAPGRAGRSPATGWRSTGDCGPDPWPIRFQAVFLRHTIDEIRQSLCGSGHPREPALTYSLSEWWMTESGRRCCTAMVQGIEHEFGAQAPGHRPARPRKTRLPRYYGPLRHPERPGLSLAGRRLARVMPPPGFPVLHPSPLHACRRHYPGGTGRCVRRSLPDRYQPSPSYRRVGFRIINFEACSAFTRVATGMAAESPVATRSVGVLQSMSLPSSTAPAATGWSDGCRAEFAPADEWRLGTAHCNFLYWLEGIGGRA